MSLSTVCSIFLGSVVSAVAIEQVTADPNIIGCTVEHHTTIQAKAGDCAEIGIVTFGGFIEARNETRFNQGGLPNHNWRGYLTLGTDYELLHQMQLELNVGARLEHESAHATMGIVEPTDNPYELIYDHTYRKCVLNGVRVGPKLVMFDELHRLFVSATFDVYAFSKNTPELPGLETAGSAGFTLGGVYRYSIFKHTSAFIAVHERFIAQSSRKIMSSIYYTVDGHLQTKNEKYPVINQVATFSTCAGISMPLFRSRHLFELYAKWLHGSIYGYVDSRDVRSVVSIGALITSR